MSEIKKNIEAGNEFAKSGLNFKNSSEVQNFYRFVSENNLRKEAEFLLKLVTKALTPKKKRGRAKKVLH